VLLLAIAVLAARSLAAEQPRLIPYRPSGIYELGEKAGWKISEPQHGFIGETRYGYKLKKNNFEVIADGSIDLASGEFKIEAVVKEPAMLYLELTPQDANETTKSPSRPIVAGAAVAPTKLKPTAPRPSDFDNFWAEKIKALKQIPSDPVLTPSDAKVSNVEYATIRMNNITGAHIYGQLAKPKRKGTFPALVIFQWASPPYALQKQWVTDRAAEGWLTLNIEPHDVLPDQPPSYYQALPETLKHYESVGNNDRDKSYFLRMYLANYRAVDYIASRPDWDGTTLVVMGTSMGGQQSLCVAGLHPKVTHLIVDVPAGCDTNGPLHGRQSSYPNFPSNDPKVMETALYFDAVNFAPRIRATSLVAMGFVDTSSAPAGIWTAFNQIPGPKELVPMIDSPHNHLATPEQQRLYTQRSAEWLNTLVKGGKVTPRGGSTKANQPVPRIDANSRLAHRQLVEKAKQGGIDLYFVGDSITRRWGCTDAQYKDFLANWKSNFFGWNAANFGWGADTTQNILWRLQNGELDNVNPKVIVILAGTNNLTANPGSDPDSAEIAQGIRAILNICREKAPSAKIILTGIFPRNDHPELMPAINRINENIEKLADGKKTYFVNINNKLADKDGKLFGGMMIDKLHPTVRGYQTWADALQPILSKELGPRSATDHAPPATGDPSARQSAPSLDVPAIGSLRCTPQLQSVEK
jgi:cephalosporin-C deacetylase-like acetyl esterase/lysophospholipase L1-like esterase